MTLLEDTAGLECRTRQNACNGGAPEADRQTVVLFLVFCTLYPSFSEVDREERSCWVWQWLHGRFREKVSSPGVFVLRGAS